MFRHHTVHSAMTSAAVGLITVLSIAQAASAGCPCGCGMAVCTMPNCSANSGRSQVQVGNTPYSSPANGSTATYRYHTAQQAPAYNTPTQLSPNDVPTAWQPYQQGLDRSGQRRQEIQSTYPGGVDFQANPYNAAGSPTYGYQNGYYRYNQFGQIIYAPPRPANAPPNYFVPSR